MDEDVISVENLTKGRKYSVRPYLLLNFLQYIVQDQGQSRIVKWGHVLLVYTSKTKELRETRQGTWEASKQIKSLGMYKL